MSSLNSVSLVWIIAHIYASQIVKYSATSPCEENTLAAVADGQQSHQQQTKSWVTNKYAELDDVVSKKLKNVTSSFHVMVAPDEAEKWTSNGKDWILYSALA